MTNAEDVIEELPTPVRAVLVRAEQVPSGQRNLLATDGLNAIERTVYEMLSAEKPKHIDEIVETSGLNSSEVLATLFDLEMKGIIRQLPGKQFAECSCKGDGDGQPLKAVAARIRGTHLRRSWMHPR